MNIFKELSTNMLSVLDTFFGANTDVMSDKVREIMANPDDRKSYLNALRRLRELEEKAETGTETITLSNDEKITLTT